MPNRLQLLFPFLLLVSSACSNPDTVQKQNGSSVITKSNEMNPTTQSTPVGKQTTSSRVSEFDFSPIKRKDQTLPPYPPEARLKRIEGDVLVEVVIDASGKPVSSKSMNGPDLLKEAAEKFAMQCPYEPLFQNGQPIRHSKKVVISYRLEK